MEMKGRQSFGYEMGVVVLNRPEIAGHTSCSFGAWPVRYLVDCSSTLSARLTLKMLVNCRQSDDSSSYG